MAKSNKNHFMEGPNLEERKKNSRFSLTIANEQFTSIMGYNLMND